MNRPPLTAAVLTGDLIGSTKATPDAVDDAIKTLAATAAEIDNWAPGLNTKFTRYRGDGWQMIITEPGLALRASILLIARLTEKPSGLRSRIAIGIGEVDRLGETDLRDASGEAFILSGRLLEAMPKKNIIDFENSATNSLDKLLMNFLDDRIKYWSEQQAEAIAAYLSTTPSTLAKIAEKLGVSPQAVSFRLNNAGKNLIDQFIDLFEKEEMWKPDHA